MSVAQQNIAQQITYDDLYRRWEEGNWKATELDFTQDKQGWESLSEIQRKSAMWVYSMFFYGEDAVADGLSPYIEAAPKEEQKYFLATQQVDEARHAVFFYRFFKEVIGVEGDIATGLEATLPELGWGYRKVFGRLEQMVEELHTDRSLPKFAQAITLYHMVIEATMAQPTQHFIEDFFVKAGTMPGFSAGMEKVSRDEQRHIGFGVKVLSELFAESEECKAAADELLREVLPYVTGIFVPPNWDERYTTEYGFTIAELYAWGMRSVEQKWRATGYPLSEHPPGIYPFDPEMPHDGASRAADHAAPCRRARRAQRKAPGEPRGRGDPLRRHRPLRPHRRGRPPGDDPVALRGRGALARADRQRLDQLRDRVSPPIRTSRCGRPGRTGSTSRCAARTPARRCCGGS